jgi:ABC-type branched-subunit amino acid transport system substrate-binding protein
MALNPSLIVIAGAITRIAPAIVQYAAATIRFELWPIPDAVPLVRASELNDDDGAIGAVAALFHQSPLLAGYPEPASTARSPQPQRSSS